MSDLSFESEKMSAITVHWNRVDLNQKISWISFGFSPFSEKNTYENYKTKIFQPISQIHYFPSDCILLNEKKNRKIKQNLNMKLPFFPYTIWSTIIIVHFIILSVPIPDASPDIHKCIVNSFFFVENIVCRSVIHAFMYPLCFPDFKKYS